MSCCSTVLFVVVFAEVLKLSESIVFFNGCWRLENAVCKPYCIYECIFPVYSMVRDSGWGVLIDRVEIIRAHVVGRQATSDKVSSTISELNAAVVFFIESDPKTADGLVPIINALKKLKSIGRPW